MTWDDQPGAVLKRMAGETSPFPYPKKPEAYLVGFKRLVDYAQEIGVRGFVVWGFLRDSHGGTEAATELCRYAADRGIAVIPGVGLCSYGGFYFEGDHPFSLSTYLKKHPERASEAIAEPSGRRVSPVLDPSLEANRKWWRDGLEWMLERFQVGGINFEMGDFLVNSSPHARAAREALGFETNDNLKDAVLATRDLVPQALKIKPKGLFTISTYRGYHQIKGFPGMPYVRALPDRTVWQYTLTNVVRQDGFPDRYAGAPPHRRYGYLHWFNTATDTMKKDYVAEIARVWPAARRLDFEFIGTYGEVSATNDPVADRNYRAQVAWAKHPDLRLEDFR